MLRAQQRVVGAVCCVALSMAGCTPGTDDPPGDVRQAPREPAAAEAPPAPAFINLLPWGKVDFARGQFPSLADCNAFVRAQPSYSGYTTPERCEPIEDPVYCTRWQEGDGPVEIDCFKGPGGCQAELPRHEMRVERNGRTLFGRCVPQPLADAWAAHRAEHPAGPSPP